MLVQWGAVTSGYGGDTGREASFLTVEECRFVDGAWKSSRRLNGDQVFFGLRLPAQGAALRVELTGQ